jgi:hypothetical protein
VPRALHLRGLQCGQCWHATASVKVMVSVQAACCTCQGVLDACGGLLTGLYRWDILVQTCEPQAGLNVVHCSILHLLPPSSSVSFSAVTEWTAYRAAASSLSRQLLVLNEGRVFSVAAVAAVDE